MSSSTSRSIPVNVPTNLLLHTLDKIDEDEAGRMVSSQYQNGSSRLKGDSDAYASCSYTTGASTDRANHRDNRWTNIYSCEYEVSSSILGTMLIVLLHVSDDHALLPGPYLNASLIPPFPYDEGPPRRSYISSQAPLPHTLPTFYRSIIAQKVPLIVNLSAFLEHGRVKADQYWPTQAGEVWNTVPCFTIKHKRDPETIGEQHRGHWEATSYHLTIDGEADGSKVQHDFELLHVTCWPDFGSFSNQVFEQLLEIIARTTNEKDPIWVHCSAGIGRSGTVVAALLAQDLGPDLAKAMKLGSLTTPTLLSEAALKSAARLVDHERRYRPKMVQTADQLGMITNAVGAILQRHQEQ